MADKTKEPKIVDIKVGQPLRQARLFKKFSQDALAQKLGITFQQLQKYENASNRISASRLYHLSLLFGVSIEYFFQDVEKISPNKDFPVDILSRPETVKLVQAYYAIPTLKTRRVFLDLLKSFAKKEDGAPKCPV
jgi:transcriptional regulator with XRE-family HTH domain